MLSSLSRETDNNPGNCFLGIPILPPILFVISIKPTAQEDLVVYFFSDFDECAHTAYVCSVYAWCKNSFGAFSCECKTGFLDVNDVVPGRNCTGELVVCKGILYIASKNLDPTSFKTLHCTTYLCEHYMTSTSF